MTTRSMLVVGVVVLAVLACVFMLYSSVQTEMQCADRMASIRLLSEFHLKFNSEAGISPDKYRAAVEKLASANPDLRGLWFYQYDLSEAEKKLNSAKPEHPSEQPK
jgi:hypothetical protein